MEIIVLNVATDNLQRAAAQRDALLASVIERHGGEPGDRLMLVDAEKKLFRIEKRSKIIIPTVPPPRAMRRRRSHG